MSAEELMYDEQSRGNQMADLLALDSFSALASPILDVREVDGKRINDQRVSWRPTDTRAHKMCIKLFTYDFSLFADATVDSLGFEALALWGMEPPALPPQPPSVWPSRPRDCTARSRRGCWYCAVATSMATAATSIAENFIVATGLGWERRICWTMGRLWTTRGDPNSKGLWEEPPDGALAARTREVMASASQNNRRESAPLARI